MAKTSISLGLAVAVGVAQDLDPAGHALGDEDVAVGGGDDLARIVQAGRRIRRPGSPWERAASRPRAADGPGEIVGRRCLERLRQVVERDLAADARARRSSSRRGPPCRSARAAFFEGSSALAAPESAAAAVIPKKIIPQ